MYLRTCSIIAQAANGATLDVSFLRCRFQIKQHIVQTPQRATIKITNQNPDTARLFVTPNAEFTTVTIMTGYQDDGSSGVLFSGNIVQAIYGRENPTDTMTQILASDGHQGHNYGVVNKSLAAGSTPMDHVNAAAAAMAQYGLSLGTIGASLGGLATPVYPRGVALYGMARDVLANIAKTKGADLSYQAGKINMLGPTDSLPGGPVKLNSTTGLIGMPTQEIGGIMARSLINTNIKVGGLVQINQADIQGLLQGVNPDGSSNVALNSTQVGSIAADGIYKVFKIDIDGDTRGNPWYMDIAALPVGQAPTSASIAAGAGLGNAVGQ